MLQNLRLSEVPYFLFGITLVIATVVLLATTLIGNHIKVIDDTWTEFQTEQAEKARLESTLRSEIGYGGMIHEFKNYILRRHESHFVAAENHLSAAISTIHQYSRLEITPAESIALEDIEQVLKAYAKSLKHAKSYILQVKAISTIDKQIKVDDKQALRGLITLRQEVRAITTKPDVPLGKGRIIADLRAAIGYGGMIHQFKNYILRQNQQQVAKILLSFQTANKLISLYLKHDTNRQEQLALTDIRSTLKAYIDKLEGIQKMIIDGKALTEIDIMARVDDSIALRGFRILDRELNKRVAQKSRNMSTELEVVRSSGQYVSWGILSIISFFMLLLIWVIRTHVISPILALTENMQQLADEDVNTKISGLIKQNEIGQMARTVQFFKNSMIKRVEAEKNLASAVFKMQKQLDDIAILREQSEIQTSRALALAEGQQSARLAADKATARAEEDELRVSAILNTVRDGIITTNNYGIIETFNPGAEDIFGYTAHDIIGKNISILMPTSSEAIHDIRMNQFKTHEPSHDNMTPFTQTARRKNGEEFPAEVTLSIMSLAEETKITALLRDVTERNKWEEEIKQLALTDPLTGLANRNLYNQELDRAVQQSERNGIHFALVILDLDKFKLINDNYGHNAGDEVLKYVSNTLTKATREVDTVARLGGDEFAIILNNTVAKEEVIPCLDRIQKKLSLSLLFDNNNVTTSASIGIAFYPNDTNDMEELTRLADQASYTSKQQGGNSYSFFTAQEDTKKT